MKGLIKLLLLLFSLSAGAQQLKKNILPEDEFLPGIVQIKLPSGESLEENTELLQILQTWDYISIKKRFPYAEIPRQGKNIRGESLADISGLYTIKIPQEKDILTLVSKLNQSGSIEIAEPHFLPKLLYVPSDDSVEVQYALSRIQAFAGWDLHRGDTNTVIGITDTGVEIFHPDIFSNIAKNYADPINGFDDDADGYTDNYYGWDTGDNDNDPSTPGNPHGQHISGISSAKTDNSTGIAGSGFNCRFIPIKIMDNNGLLSGAYEGLVYAAEHGCSVINCSWGGYQYSAINEEIIRYVSVNLDRLVFCGAGNDNNERLFYPASYPYAVSVGATNDQDSKADFSNFGDRLDIYAPGDLILSTWTNGEYQRSGGTSMSSPLTAGCAAILRSAFPDRSAQQILFQLKTTADAVDNLPSNATWLNKMGSGRLNLFRALSETTHPAVVIIEPEITDNADQLFLPGDTLFLSGTFINYLNAANNVQVTAESLTNNLLILNPDRNLGGMSNLQTLDFSDNPFKVLILETTSFNEIARLRINIVADGNEIRQTFPLKINASFINLNHNDVMASIGASGQIGPTGDQYLKGFGVKFTNETNFLYEGGLMVSTERNVVVNGIRGNVGNANFWEADERFMRVAPFENHTIQFRAGMQSILPEAPLRVKQRVIADSINPNRGFFIVEYEITNESPFDKDSCYAGIFTDWDLGDYSKNKASFVNPLKLSYVYEHLNDTAFAGVQLLENHPIVVHAIENTPGGNGGLNLSDGFSIDEKYFSLSSSLPEAGIDGEGTDIITVTSAGPFQLNINEPVRIAFAFHLAKSQSELFNQAVEARNFYNTIGIPLSINSEGDKKSEFEVFPNPNSGRFRISSIYKSNCDFTVLDITGKAITSGKIVNQNTEITLPKNLNSGIYFLKLQNEQWMEVKKLMITSGNN